MGDTNGGTENDNNPLNKPLSDYLSPRFSNAFQRAERYTPAELALDVIKRGVQLTSSGRYVCNRWIFMRNIGEVTCEVALDLLLRLGFDWREHIKPDPYWNRPFPNNALLERAEKRIEINIDSLIEQIQRYAALRIESTSLTREEISLIITVINFWQAFTPQPPPAPGQVTRLREKLSIMFDAARK